MTLQEHLTAVNSLHKNLREALTNCNDEQKVVDCFIALHSQLHSKRVSPHTPWSYEDWLLDDLTKAQIRAVPEGQEHSIAWIIWHLTRIEDVTMNLLVAGRDQVFEAGDWQEKTASPIKHTGNGTGLDTVKTLSAAVDIVALRAYRVAVGLATQALVQSLTAEDFNRKVSPDHIQRICIEGAVISEGQEAIDYWSRRDVAGLLLMPPTRHTIVHWNEAEQLKRLIS